MKKIYFFIAVTLISSACSCSKTEDNANTLWSAQKATEWYESKDWIRGCNFIPSTAINQLEMWQEETFDTTTIDRELGMAEGLGFNTMRVYLHSLAWKQDPEGFKIRMDQYLTIADRHEISTVFVFFDDCWNANATIGKQPEPKPGTHNSGWLQDPSCDMREDTIVLNIWLRQYVQDVLYTFGKDTRVLMWDMYNEPGNSGHGWNSIPLLKNAFEWAREANPEQPLTSAIWALNLYKINDIQLHNSDILTYHNYNDANTHWAWIYFLRSFDSERPVVCTEWMHRRMNGLFTNTLRLFKDEKVGALNWGLVSGKTNTIYGWDEVIADGSEPEVWFHDILRQDGTPFSQAEADSINAITGVN